MNADDDLTTERAHLHHATEFLPIHPDRTGLDEMRDRVISLFDRYGVTIPEYNWDEAGQWTAKHEHAAWCQLLANMTGVELSSSEISVVAIQKLSIARAIELRLPGFIFAELGHAQRGKPMHDLHVQIDRTIARTVYSEPERNGGGEIVRWIGRKHPLGLSEAVRLCQSDLDAITDNFHQHRENLASGGNGQGPSRVHYDGKSFANYRTNYYNRTKARRQKNGQDDAASLTSAEVGQVKSYRALRRLWAAASVLVLPDKRTVAPTTS